MSKSVRRLFMKAEGITSGGVGELSGRKIIDRAFKEGKANTELGNQILKLNAALERKDFAFMETILESMKEGEAKDWFLRALKSLKVHHLEIEILRLKGKYGICKICGKEKEYYYGPDVIQIDEDDERQICVDCIKEKRLREKQEKYQQRIEGGKLFEKPDCWRAEKVDELTEILNKEFKEASISLEIFTKIQDLLYEIADSLSS